MRKIISLPLDTSTPHLFQVCQCKYPRSFVTRFGITYNSFRSSASGTGIPKGVIAGIVVGIFLGVIAFPILGFILWRRRQRKGSGDFNFIEPSIHKVIDITDVLDIQPGGLGQGRKPPAQSPVSEVSLDFFPVNIPQVTYPQSEPSPPTLPRSPTTSSPSPTQHLHDIGDHDVVHSPEAVDQPYLGVHIRSSLQADLENTPSLGLNRRSSVPKPAGPRPQYHRANTDDPQTSVLIPPAQIVTDSSHTSDKEPTKPSEPQMEQVNEGGRLTIYSFLDLSSTSEPTSTTESTGQSRNSTQPPSHTNLDSPRHSFITGTNSIQSRRDSDRRRESGNSRPLSLSAVIQRPPTSGLPPVTEPHPYSPYPATLLRTPQSHRPRAGGASPTESIPRTTSEVSEIRFSNPGESSEPGAPLQSPLLNANPTTSPIYQKLFGTVRGEVPPDGLLEKKRSLHRKAFSAPTLPRM